MNVSPVRGLLLAAAVLGLAVPGLAADKRKITETDLFRFVWVADPQISPDGKRVAFVRVTVNAKKEGYDTAVWIVPTDASEPARAFTAGPRDSSPRWSPDGTTLAFLRSASKDGKPEPPQIHVIPAGGGEARGVTDLPRGAGAPVWSPDGESLAFTSPANAKDLEKKAKRKQAPDAEGRQEGRRGARERRPGDHPRRSTASTAAATPDDSPAQPRVGRSTCPRRARRPSPSSSRAAPFDEDNLAFSPDGSRIFYTTNRTKDPSYAPPDADLYSVAAAGGESPCSRRRIDGPIGDYALSADGRRVAFVGYLNPKPARSFDQPDLFVADLPGGAAEEPDRGLRLRRGRRDHRRPAGAPRGPAHAPRLEPRPAVRDRQGRRARPGEPAQVQRGHGDGGRPHHRRPGRPGLLGRAPTPRRLRGRRLHPHQHRRSVPRGRPERPDAAALPARTRTSWPSSTSRRPRSSSTRASTGGRSRPGSRSRPTTWPGSATR